METAAVNNLGFTTQRAAQDSQVLSQDFDDFLQLLTTQLQHQDPFDPLDSAEFTNQLVAFSQVEQAIASNDKLEQLLAFNAVGVIGLGLGYIGLAVQVPGDTLKFSGEAQSVDYVLPEAASAVQITIKDSDGNPVRTFSGETQPGNHNFVWDGTDNDGNVLDPGLYTVDVSATAENGTFLNTQIAVPSVVTGVENRDGIVYLNLEGGDSIVIGDVLSARLPGT